MARMFRILIFIAAFFTCSFSAYGVDRISPPEFETGYQMPVTTTGPPRADIYEYIDVVVLLLTLLLAAYFALKLRSRKCLFVLMLFSLAYFGFWRKGCVCSIGALQNIALALFEPDYALPISVLLFLLLPLVSTLFFGRIFCSAICPIGAIQDLVLLKPVSVPSWLESPLRLFAWLYLSLAILLAATGSAFIICRYDPFIAFFRVSGNINMLITGGCFLIVAIFIGRPYCRFLCPYGVILGQLSRLTKWHVTITPDKCVKCRLCEDSCPFGAIQKPTFQWPRRDYNKDKKRLALLLGLLPIMIISLALLAQTTSGWMSQAHPRVKLATEVFLHETTNVKETTDPVLAFRSTGEDPQQLYAQALHIRSQFKTGTFILGAFLGLVIALKLITHALRVPISDYQTEKAACLSCARCFEYCPYEHARLKNKLTSGDDK